MNRFVRQCDEIFFLRFYKFGFLWEVVALCIDLLCCDFEKWNKQLCRDKSCQFRPPNKAKRSFFARTFEDQKSVQYKEKWAVHVFRNWQTAREKNHILLLWPGSVFKACKVLKKRLEDLHSLSLKFCLTKFFRTIERAFVQMSHSFVNWFPNTRVCIS